MVISSFDISRVFEGVTVAVAIVPVLAMLILSFVLPKGSVQLSVIIAGVLLALTAAFHGVGAWNVIGEVSSSFLVTGIVYIIGMSIYLRQPTIIVETKSDGIMDVFLYEMPGKRLGAYAIKLLYIAFLGMLIFMRVSPDTEVTTWVQASSFLCCIVAVFLFVIQLLLRMMFDKWF